MRTRLLHLIIGMTLALPALVNADYCAERTSAALEELAAVYGPAGSTDGEAVRGVLLRLCQDARAEAVPAVAAVGVEGEPADGAGGAAAAAEPETTRLLGVEFRKAAPDSAGNQRLRRRP